MNHITIHGLQQYIKAKDYRPTQKKDYFIKLSEEVGELARAILINTAPADSATFKGSIEEELYDVVYYALALGNVYDIDLESWIPVKEQLNDEKYGDNYAVTLPFIPIE